MGEMGGNKMTKIKDVGNIKSLVKLAHSPVASLSLLSRPLVAKSLEHLVCPLPQSQ